MTIAPLPPRARPARPVRRILIGATLLAVGGCHFGRKSEPPTATVRIRNDLVPAAALTISLLPASGARRTIGVVEPSRTMELRVPLGSSADPHRLIAEAGSGPATVSRQFTWSNAAVVEWNVGQNTLNVAARQ